MKPLLLSLLFLASISVFSQQWNWGRQGINTSTTQTARGIGHDKYGNVYVLGNGASTATFYNLNLQPGSFLIKYDSTGTLIWGINVPTQAQRIAVDADGYTYIAGEFYGTLTSGTLTMNSNGGSDFFLLRYSPSGIRLWERSYGGTGGDFCNAIATDSNGNIYFTGSFKGSIAFGSYLLQNNPADPQFYLTKLTPAGNTDWAVSGDTSYYGAQHLFINKNNIIFVEGHYQDTVTSWPCSGFFHDRYNTNGSRIYNKKICMYNYANSDMTVDDSMYVYHIDISSQYSDINLRKHDSLMNFKWSKPIGGGYSKFTLATGLTTDAAGNIYLAGNVGGPYCFCDSAQVQTGSGWVKVNGSSDLAVAKYNTNGNLVWIKTADGKSAEMVTDMSRDIHGNIYLTGIFNYHFIESSQIIGPVTIASDVLTPDGSWEQLFVARLSSPSIAADLKSFAADQTGLQIYPNPSTGIFTVNFEGKGALIKVYNAIGELIFTATANDNNYQVDLSAYPKGLYLVQMFSDGKRSDSHRIEKKIIKD